MRGKETCYIWGVDFIKESGGKWEKDPDEEESARTRILNERKSGYLREREGEREE